MPRHGEQHYVATYKGKEEFGEIDGRHSTDLDWGKRNLAEKLIRGLGLTTPRNDPKKVKVSISRIDLVKGQATRHLIGSVEVDVPFVKLNRDTYKIEMDGILKELPEEFHRIVWSIVGDVAYEESICRAHELVHDLKPCIEAFERRIKTKK